MSKRSVSSCQTGYYNLKRLFRIATACYYSAPNKQAGWQQRLKDHPLGIGPGHWKSEARRGYSAHGWWRLTSVLVQLGLDNPLELHLTTASQLHCDGVQRQRLRIYNLVCRRLCLSRRPNFDFFKMGFPKGSEVRFLDRPEEKIYVESENTVIWNDNTFQVNTLRTKMGLPTPYLHNVIVNGKSLLEAYESTYPKQ